LNLVRPIQDFLKRTELSKQCRRRFGSHLFRAPDVIRRIAHQYLEIGVPFRRNAKTHYDVRRRKNLRMFSPVAQNTDSLRYQLKKITVK